MENYEKPLAPPEIKVVLFDLDDTLFDNQHSNRAGLTVLQQKFDCFSQKSLSDLEKDFTQILDEIVPKVLQGQLSREESQLERFRRFTGLYGITITDEEAAALGACYGEANRASRRAIPGAIALLQRLKTVKADLKIGVVTNHLVAQQQEKLRECNMDSLIDFLVVSEEVGVTKPNPIIFEVALQRAGCQPHEAIMVGDSWKADVLGARAVGIRPVWFNRNETLCPDPSLADELHAFEPLADVVKILLGLG